MCLFPDTNSEKAPHPTAMASRDDRAVLEGFGEILLDLVSKHATQRQWNEWLKVPLELGLRRGDSDLVSRLLVAGSVAREGSSGKDNHPLLLTAFAERHHDKGGPGGIPSQGAAQRRAHDGVDGVIEAPAGGVSNDAPPSTLLHSAIRQGDADMVSELLRKRADVDMLDFDGRSPLRVAVSACSLPVVKVLLEQGAGASAAIFGEDVRGLPSISLFPVSLSCIIRIHMHGLAVSANVGCSWEKLTQQRCARRFVHLDLSFFNMSQAWEKPDEPPERTRTARLCASLFKNLDGAFPNLRR